MAPTSMRAMENMGTGSSPGGCSYTDGPQYVGCQVAARGWPTPQYMSGGKRKRKMSRRRRKSRGKRAKRAGSLVGNAIVPFGLLAAQKRSQRRHGHAHGKSHKKRSSRRYRR
jgi:hypothetical protein